jgi:hypothetical protein
MKTAGGIYARPQVNPREIFVVDIAVDELDEMARFHGVRHCADFADDIDARLLRYQPTRVMNGHHRHMHFRAISRLWPGHVKNAIASLEVRGW